MRRRKVRVRRENLSDQHISLRVQFAFGLFLPPISLLAHFADGWMSTLLSTRPDEIEKRLAKFLPLRRLIAYGIYLHTLLCLRQADAAISLVELKYGEIFLASIKGL